MLYKSKINLSLILLIVGIGLIPTGLFIKAYIGDDVSSQVTPFLISLEEEVNDEIEANYLGLGIYNVLPAIHDEHITELEEDFVLVYGIPSTLLYLRNVTIDLFPEYYNASRTARLISTTVNNVRDFNETVETRAEARDLLFNSITFEDEFFTPIEGVSEYMTGGTVSLNYSASSINYLLNGRDLDGASYPGIQQNPSYGTGLLDWLEFYYNAKANIGTNRTLMQTVYQCNWTNGRLQNLTAYITTYLWDIIIKNDYAPMDYETYLERVFYDQWANGTWVSAGFDLSFFTEYIPSVTTGLEAGRNTATNIQYNSAINLWDSSNSSSFVHDAGILKWFDAYGGNVTAENELKADFGLTSTHVTRIYSWLFGPVRNNLVRYIYPLPAPIGAGIPISDYSDIIYAAQWANGTYIPEGLDLKADVEPFEIGLPIKSNITLESALALLDPSNTSSFADRDGIIDWIDAYEGDSAIQTELMTIFNLDLDQITLIYDWLFDTFRYNITPSITNRYTGLRMYEYAQFEFYRQWADRAIFDTGLDIGVFQGLTSVSDWEIGIPTGTNIDEFTAYMLWNQNEDYSFVNWKGISYWYKAMQDPNWYDFIQEYYNTAVIRIGLDYYNASLSIAQFDAILLWIVNIRDNYVLPNIQNLGNLPTDSYTLGNNIFFMFTIAGGIIGGIGALGIVVLIITKRK
ncbi:MAG: hypothetical protein ACFFE5_07500 [Candidatus Thorarchaeota archaeon]